VDKRKKRFEYLENIAEEIKAFLSISKKKKTQSLCPQLDPAPDNFTLEYLHISDLCMMDLNRNQIYHIDRAIKTYDNFGKSHVAQLIGELIELLLESQRIFPKERLEILDKFSILIKEMSTPEIYQKTGVINTLYPEVRKMILLTEVLNDKWRNLEAALENSSRKSISF